MFNLMPNTKLSFSSQTLGLYKIGSSFLLSPNITNTPHIPPLHIEVQLTTHHQTLLHPKNSIDYINMCN
jgi:hypothetical protein